MRLARNLRLAREKANGGRGFSQGEVAKRLGVTRQTVNRSESEDPNAAKPRDDYLERVAILYGTTVQALRYEEGAGEPNAAKGTMVREDQPREERAWLYTFAGQLAALGATEAEIAAAQSLVAAPTAITFYQGDRQRAMQELAGVVLREIERRYNAAAPTSTKDGGGSRRAIREREGGRSPTPAVPAATVPSVPAPVRAVSGQRRRGR